MTKYVAYYRVSTKSQANSGLGLEAQRSAVQNFTRGVDDIVLHEFTDVESGKINTRPMLLQAIESAIRLYAKLLIAKLDRLSRNASFIFTLRDSKVDFICCDMPDANSLTIGILAVLAQDERERISARTKSALQELKRKGFKLGTPENLTSMSRSRSLETRKENANQNENNRKAGALIVAMRVQGVSYTVICKELNKLGFKSRRGGEFSITQAQRLYNRYFD